MHTSEYCKEHTNRPYTNHFSPVVQVYSLYNLLQHAAIIAQKHTKTHNGYSMSSDKLFMLFGCVLSGSGVALGAFGAHGLRKVVSSEMLSVYQTGVLYQLIHGIALLVVGLAWRQYGGGVINTAGWFLIIGTLLFSGSLYVLSMTSIRYIGLLTPLGGLAFIIGWVTLFIGIWRAS